MPPVEPRGLPELREVMGRYNTRARLGLGEDELAQIAHHIHHGHSEGPLDPDNPADAPYLDREEWKKLALLGDSFGWQQMGEGQGMPETLFGQKFNQEHHGDYIATPSHGWTDEEVHKLGRKPHKFELSPGDRSDHQNLRDREYLEAFTSPDAMIKGAPYYHPNTVKDALDYYDRSKDANYSHGGNGWDMWRTANFKRHAGLQGMVGALTNPEFAAGNAFTGASVAADFIGGQAVENPGQKDWIAPGIRNGSPAGAMAAGVGDFAFNTARSIADGTAGQEWQDAYERWEMANANNISPAIPQSGINDWKDTPENRADAIKEMQQLQVDNHGHDFDTYHRAKTGVTPSYGGSLAATQAHEIVTDPITLAMGGTSLARGLLRAGAKGAGRNLFKEALLGAGKLVGNEVKEEAGQAIPFVGAMEYASPLPKPALRDAFSPVPANATEEQLKRARPDLAADPSWKKDDGEFRDYVNNQADQDVTKARARTQTLNQAAKPLRRSLLSDGPSFMSGQ
jgi:hypothetical protein